MMYIKRPFTLVLGGGGARGIAHLGVCKVLEREKLLPSLIVGTSMGAVMGAMFAQTLNTSECEERLDALFRSDFFRKIGLDFFLLEDSADRHTKLNRLIGKAKRHFYLSRTLTRTGALPNEVLSEALSYLIEDMRMEELKIPLATVATDLESGTPITLIDGSLRTAVGASASIPAIAAPTEIDGRLLVDGGASCITPVIPAQKLSANPIVAVDVWKALPEYKEPTRGLSVLIRAGEITQLNLNNSLLMYADAVISPEVKQYHWIKFDRYRELIRLGAEAAERALPAIRKAAEGHPRSRKNRFLRLFTGKILPG